MIHLSDTESQIQNVLNFQDLISTPFQGEINAMCWNRNLIGDFSEIVKKIELKENMIELDLEKLRELQLSEQGQLARKILLNDFNLLKEHGASPTLNIIKNYERDDAFPFFPTDVYSYHVDRSPIPTATFLCTYYGASSDILPNSQATQKVLIPEIRAELKKLHGEDEKGFESFLSEYFFDLHYQEKPKSQPINLGIGHLWKLAIDHPESKVLPCIHRAPNEKHGESRLLLIC
ncbi:hypothetical protein [Polaribacter sp. Hel1_85]|uniref:hypothetical protein n=1 Tax=Polaribacter sp. Hel1_85 TaxID=1250005 RepID=UPI00052D8E12|nr:hypothetical protein [Polaribacter sp. Hel1_85]KGL58535.1 surface antigen variable number repeat protein-containing protein [Polaribacter sp. Hel1_85]